MDKLKRAASLPYGYALAVLAWPPAWYLLGGIVLDRAAAYTGDLTQARLVLGLGLIFMAMVWPDPVAASRAVDTVDRVEELLAMPAPERVALQYAYRTDELLAMPGPELEHIRAILATTPPEGIKPRSGPPRRRTP